MLRINNITAERISPHQATQVDRTVLMYTRDIFVTKTKMKTRIIHLFREYKNKNYSHLKN